MKPIIGTVAVCAAALAVISAAGAAGAATVLYTDDFSAGTPVGGLAGSNGFAGGMYYNASTGGAPAGYQLALGGLGAHSLVTVSFSLALIDSWDGTSPWGWPYGDYFNVTADGAEVFEISVDNFGSGSVEQVPATATGRASGQNLFGSGYGDSTFTVAFSFLHSGATLDLAMFADGIGWQGGTDESWAIDNLTVSADVAPVPLPAALPLLAGALGGLGALAARRRRRC
ncbi:hypothetical protein V8J36_06820 [Frigidibacter sp. MR17.14]|uniref:hypothetical protein n=1 Tax=Frigidibacter sp. MR17.14 TaxID=3126509 RepID=UPI00301317D1